MKALLTAFALLSFVAASTLPMAASAADAQTDHTMNKPDKPMPSKSMTSDKHAKPDTAKHVTKTHKKTVHKKTKHHHTAKKVKKHKNVTAPKAG